MLCIHIRIASSRDSNEYTQYTILTIKKITLKYLRSAAMGFFFQGTQEEVRNSRGKRSVFEALKFYCTLYNDETRGKLNQQLFPKQVVFQLPELKTTVTCLFSPIFLFTNYKTRQAKRATIWVPLPPPPKQQQQQKKHTALERSVI